MEEQLIMEQEFMSHEIPSSSPQLPPLRSKKRNYSSASISDVPFFSSDDLAEASEAVYRTPRRKRQYMRRWWEDPDPANAYTREQIREAKRRPKDSGVFMSSDSSTGNEDGFSVRDLKVALPKKPWDSVQSRDKHPQPIISSGDQLIEDLVEKCLDTGGSVIDAGSYNLKSISSHSLRPLRDLIREPKWDGTRRDDGQYHSFAPDLKLILSSNQLEQLPGELSSLSNLIFLTIRNNQIKEIPSSIRNLKRLTELNVSGNKLKSLPWEMLDLLGPKGRLRIFNYSSNPLLQPVDLSSLRIARVSFGVTAEEATAHILDLDSRIRASEAENETSLASFLKIIRKIQDVRLHRLENNDSAGQERPSHSHGSQISTRAEEPIYIGSTEVAFYELDGSLRKQCSFSLSSLPDDQNVLKLSLEYSGMHTECEILQREAWSKAPSLFESALRSCMIAAEVCPLDTLLPTHTPITILKAIKRVQEAAERGGDHCSVCQQLFVIARAEWIEYWHCAQNNLSCAASDIAIPFLRRACSWSCAFDIWRNKKQS